MTVIADVGIDVEVVEEDETLRQRVSVGGDVAAEQRERRIAVALGEIAEHLIVGAVLADHVEDVLDGRCAADGTRNRRTYRNARIRQTVGVRIRRECEDFALIPPELCDRVSAAGTQPVSRLSMFAFWCSR